MSTIMPILELVYLITTENTGTIARTDAQIAEAVKQVGGPCEVVSAVILVSEQGTETLLEGTEEVCRGFLNTMKHACLNTWFPELNQRPSAAGAAETAVTDVEPGEEIDYTAVKPLDLRSTANPDLLGKATLSISPVRHTYSYAYVKQDVRKLPREVGCLHCGCIVELEQESLAECPVCHTQNFSRLELEGMTEGQAVKTAREVTARMHGLMELEKLLSAFGQSRPYKHWQTDDGKHVVTIRELANMEVTKRDPKWRPMVCYTHHNGSDLYVLPMHEFLKKYRGIQE